jgi:glycosyltransferase involved in cell wall biosynthesis
MKISIYTFVQNGLYYDFHVVAMLKHHIPLVDEIIVNEGYSKDGTYEAICNLDPKVKVFRSHWDRSDPSTWHLKFKNEARKRCTGDWCILLDCDEFMPEWEFDRLRAEIATTKKDILPVKFKHFYGNYRVYKARNDSVTKTPVLGNRIHRNLENIEVWGDGANVWKLGETYQPPTADLTFDVHHFGEVRNAARLRQKWRTQAKQHRAENPKWDWVPGFIFNLFPHNWLDQDFLEDLDVYEGPLIQAVRDNPAEFDRDRKVLLNFLLNREGKGS